MSGSRPLRILIVDDNAQYRQAFSRMLRLEGCEVSEAADADEGVERLQEDAPDVVVTDLQMRTEREGLDLIETIKATDPLLPVIMISGVGSFEEGALATKMGAARVIHKSTIEDEMDGFAGTLREAYEACRKSRQQLAVVAAARQQSLAADGTPDVDSVRALVADPTVDPHVKGEAYDFITTVGEADLLRESESDMREAAASAQFEELQAMALDRLRGAIPEYDQLAEESRKSLASAEYLYGMQDEGTADMDLSRTIAFSYCFAAESEVRARLKGKITRLGSDRLNQRVFEACVDRKTRRLDVAFQQQLMLTMRRGGIKFTIDNVKHVLLGLMHRKERYRPDGLKDVGILLLCFGREYRFSRWGRLLDVSNPLRLKGLSSGDDVIRLAGLLIALQYARNPYIHPDVQKRERLATVRQTAFDCLDELSKLR